MSARAPRTPRRKSATLTKAAAVPLLGQPLQVGQVVRVRRPDPIEEGRQRAGGPGLPVDLLGRPVAGDDREEVVDDPGLRVEQESR